MTLLLFITLHQLFYVLAIGGGILLLGQIISSLMGGDSDADLDVDTDIDSADYDVDGPGDSGTVKFLTFGGAITFIAFFGIAGTTSLELGLSNLYSILIATAIGILCSVIMAYVMFAFKKLQGTTRTMNSKDIVGKTATVYLVIPGDDQKGKIQLNVNEKFVTIDALSQNGDKIETNSMVKVSEFITDTLVKVTKLN